jgi:hypothetical protein
MPLLVTTELVLKMINPFGPGVNDARSMLLAGPLLPNTT